MILAVSIQLIQPQGNRSRILRNRNTDFSLRSPVTHLTAPVDRRLPVIVKEHFKFQTCPLTVVHLIIYADHRREHAIPLSLDIIDDFRRRMDAESFFIADSFSVRTGKTNRIPVV